ncbi:hypothetical protein ACTMTF_07605 [Nonomuraea sp. ZG12]|uniref:hypothetical protein n=1 Tax=Nonomuraea sp. ZG12 TaxID=3452207 RepID=UPI003F88A226
MWRTISALAVLLAISACSDGATVREPPDSFTQTKTQTERDMLDRAEQLLLRDCMRKHGFKVWMTPPDNTMPQSLQFPYVLTDIDWAKKHGYGGDLQERAAALAEADPNKRYFQGLSKQARAAARAALNGPAPVGLEAKVPLGGTMRRSDRGCVSEAERLLYGDLRTWYRVTKVTEQLRPLRAGKVLEDAGYKAGLAEWSACMRGRGHDYARPAAARGAMLGGADRHDRAEEIRTAVAEATCARDTGLTDTVRRLDARYERDLVARYRSDIKAKRDLELAALPRAAAIIAERDIRKEGTE